MKKNYFTSIIPIKTLKTFRFLLVISFSISSYCQDVKNHLFTASGYLEVPAGVTSLSVKCWGAGGGGGGADKLLNFLGVAAAGGGGGGGAFSKGIVTVGKKVFPPGEPLRLVDV